MVDPKTVHEKLSYTNMLLSDHLKPNVLKLETDADL